MIPSLPPLKIYYPEFNLKKDELRKKYLKFAV